MKRLFLLLLVLLGTFVLSACAASTPTRTVALEKHMNYQDCGDIIPPSYIPVSSSRTDAANIGILVTNLQEADGVIRTAARVIYCYKNQARIAQGLEPLPQLQERAPVDFGTKPVGKPITTTPVAAPAPKPQPPKAQAVTRSAATKKENTSASKPAKPVTGSKKVQKSTVKSKFTE